jgi:5-methylcytosine-specific restriction enzyme subunit McrC
MYNKKDNIRVFEHQCVRKGDIIDGVEIKDPHIQSLQAFNPNGELPYYTLILNGVKFCEYVGVISTKILTVEILPKVDRLTDNNNDDQTKKKWQNILIDMLMACGYLEVLSLSNANLKIKPNSILELYVLLFLREVEKLIHQGLIKKYRTVSENKTFCKGKIIFSKHITENQVHKERFYIQYSTYDKENLLNEILNETLKIIPQIIDNSYLLGYTGKIALDFPELSAIKINEPVFQKIKYDRKSERYKTSVEIAKLLLLNYHPNIQKGKENVLALLFDMNMLWEKYIARQLKKVRELNFKVYEQSSKKFCSIYNVKPDIFLKSNNQSETNSPNIIIDTKWKILWNRLPSIDDIRQMYVYNQYFNAHKSILLYPDLIGNTPDEITFELEKHKCLVKSINIFEGDKLKKDISNELKALINT